MSINNRILDFFRKSDIPTPYLLIDLDKVAANYVRLRAAMPAARHYYAIKANPEHGILQTLNALGCCFEVASVNEIEACLNAGAPPENLLYGNPLKKKSEIKRAYELGIREFVFDNIVEARKIAEQAPESRVVCRIISDGHGAVSPLTIKFGCPAENAEQWLRECKAMGLIPFGVSFHTGSQQLVLSAWEKPLADAARIFKNLEKDGIELQIIDVGGGFPVRYRSDIPSIEEFGKTIQSFADKYFDRPPLLYTEPGRYMTGDAGHILSEVVLVSPSYSNPDLRWVYLDIGRYGGLVEEKIDYPVRLLDERPTSPQGCVVLAGQTCDSNDVIYRETFGYALPADLEPGEKVILVNTGCYTTTYSTTLNGFNTLQAYCLPQENTDMNDKTSHTNPSVYPDAFLAHPDTAHLDPSKLIERTAIEIRDSVEFGEGVYARRSFKAGEIIGGFAGTFTSELLQHSLQVEPGRNILDPHFVGYLQHNCDPNCVLDMKAQIVTCIRDIEAGQALTMDYSSTEDVLFRQFPCMCDAPDCRYWITGNKENPSEEGQAYLRKEGKAA